MMFELQLLVLLILNSQLSMAIRLTSLFHCPSQMLYVWWRILQRRRAAWTRSRHGSWKISCNSLHRTSRTSSTGRWWRATFLRCSAWLRLRRSSKSPHSIHQCSAATGPSRICRSSRRCWSGLLMSGCLNTYNRTDSCRKINPRTDVATQRKPLFWRWPQMHWLLLIRVNSPCLVCLTSVPPSIVWITTSFSTDSRHRSDSLESFSTGCDRTSSERGSMWDTMGLHPQQQWRSAAFLRVPYLAHCISSFILQMHFELLGSWGSSSMDMQMICRSTITALPVTRPGSPIDLFTASRSWDVGCQATAWGSIHRRRNSSGWVRHVVWLDVPSIQSTSAGKLYNHHKRFVISERILTPPLVSPSTSPGWWRRVTFTSANSGRSVGRSPSSPRTPWWGRWSWHASTTVTDFLSPKFRKWLHDSFSLISDSLEKFAST